MTSLSRHRAEQFLYSFFPVVLPMASGFIIHLLMARSLLPQDYAVIPQALALVSLATTIAYFINHDVAAREIAIAEDPRRTTVAFFTGRILFTLAGAIVCILAAFLMYGSEIKTMALFLLWFVASIGINENLSQVWRANGEYRKTSLLYLINFLALLAGLIYIQQHQATPLKLAVVLLFSTIAAAAFFTGSLIGCLKQPDFDALKKILKKSLPIALTGIALYISNWFGVMYLAAAGISQDLTYYFLAGKFAGAHVIVIFILYFAYIPALSRKDDEKLETIFKKWFWVVVMYAGLSSLGVIYILLPVVIKFWGPEYQKVQIYYIYYVPWIFFSCISYYTGMFIYARGLVSIIGKFQIILAVLTVFIVIFGYSKWGTISLPLAESLAMLIAGISQYVLWQRHRNNIT
jgi:O-antigen/teichoic acid export membrane protein